MLRAQGVCALIGALCLGLPSAVSAQSMGVGVKGGLAVASIPLSGEVFDQVVGHQSIDSSSKLGVAAGGYVRFPISRLFYFQPEAMYTMKGSKLTEANGAGELSARLHYIDVPLLLHYRVRPEQKWPGYLFGGVNFGMKLGSSAKLSGTAAAADVDIEPALKTNDVGIAFGGGIESGRYLYEARVTLGLSDIGAESFPHLDALRNRTILLLVGRKFK
jgi:outer membrane protein with beta-barrel domain